MSEFFVFGFDVFFVVAVLFCADVDSFNNFDALVFELGDFVGVVCEEFYLCDAEIF
jgi:hypothetical protein